MGRRRKKRGGKPRLYATRAAGEKRGERGGLHVIMRCGVGLVPFLTKSEKLPISAGGKRFFS